MNYTENDQADTRHHAPNPEGLAVIEEMLRVTRKTKLVAGGLIAAMGVPLLLLPLAVKESEAAIVAGLGAVAVGLGCFFLAQGYRLRHVRRAPVYRALVESPERIVWYYEDITRANGVDNSSVVLFCSDGTKFEFNLKFFADPDRLLRTLADMLPHAVFGYSPERKKAYRKSPAQFTQIARAVSASA